MKKKKLLIIPAKGNSSRIRNKNIKNFFGKPIISYSIEAAQKSKIFDTIHVSTDSKKIFNLAKKLGAKPLFYRDKKLTTNNIGIFDVIKSDYLNFKKRGFIFDEIWCLFPCAPLITFNDLKKLNKNINLKKIGLPCISISKFPAPIQWAYSKNKKNKITPFFNNYHLIQSQKLKESFFDVGILSVFDKNNLIYYDKKTINKNLYGYQLPWDKVIDIDDIEDWKIAKKLFSLK